DVEQITGRFTGSPDERETSVGIELPIEVGGKRRRRGEAAQARVGAVGAGGADREPPRTFEERTVERQALAALRELETTESINQIDLQTTRFVQARVNEGESAPLELNLLRAEVDRLRSRRALVEGRLTTALLKLKVLTGISDPEPLRLRED